MLKSLTVLLLGALLLGVLPSCGKSESGKPPVTDGVKETLDYGGTVGKSYNQSKEKIQNLNEEHNRQLEDALQDMP